MNSPAVEDARPQAENRRGIKVSSKVLTPHSKAEMILKNKTSTHIQCPSRKKNIKQQMPAPKNSRMADFFSLLQKRFISLPESRTPTKLNSGIQEEATEITAVSG